MWKRRKTLREIDAETQALINELDKIQLDSAEREAMRKHILQRARARRKEIVDSKL